MINLISKDVHLEPIERAAQNPLILGLFPPLQLGAWSPSPKPINGRCILVNAASSTAGFTYAVRHSDFIFVTSPAGADPVNACDALPTHNAKIKAAAKERHRTIRTIINPHVICRDTEKEARAQYQSILDHQDPVAADNFHATFASGDQSS